MDRSLEVAPVKPGNFLFVFFLLFAMMCATGVALFIPVWTFDIVGFAFMAAFVGAALFFILREFHRIEKENWQAGAYLKIDARSYSLPRFMKSGSLDEIEAFHLIAGWPGDYADLEDNGGCVSELHVYLKSGEKFMVIGAAGMKALDICAARIAERAGVPLIVNKQAIEPTMFGKPRVVE